MKTKTVGIIVSLSVTLLVTGNLIAQMSPTAKDVDFSKGIIKGKVNLKNIKEFKDAALLHLNEAIANGGLAVVEKGASEQCAVDKTVDFRVINEKVVCSKTAKSNVELKPLSVEQAVALRDALAVQIDKIAKEQKLGLSTLRVTANGIEGQLTVAKEISVKDAAENLVKENIKINNILENKVVKPSP